MIAPERPLRSTAFPTRGGTIKTELRNISGQEATPSNTRANAESTARQHVMNLQLNAIAILYYQDQWWIAV